MSYNQDKEEFIKYLQFQKHYSINTVESYQRSLNEFIDFLKVKVFLTLTMSSIQI